MNKMQLSFVTILVDRTIVSVNLRGPMIKALVSLYITWLAFNDGGYLQGLSYLNNICCLFIIFIVVYMSICCLVAVFVLRCNIPLQHTLILCFNFKYAIYLYANIDNIASTFISKPTSIVFVFMFYVYVVKLILLIFGLI